MPSWNRRYRRPCQATNFRQIKYWSVDYFHAKARRKSCRRNPNFVKHLGRRFKKTNASAAEHVFAWFRNDARSLNKAPPKRHFFKVLVFIKRKGNYSLRTCLKKQFREFYCLDGGGGCLFFSGSNEQRRTQINHWVHIHLNCTCACQSRSGSQVFNRDYAAAAKCERWHELSRDCSVVPARRKCVSERQMLLASALARAFGNPGGFGSSFCAG